MIALCYKDNTLRLLWLNTTKGTYDLIFYCPYLNEGLPALINIQGSPICSL